MDPPFWFLIAGAARPQAGRESNPRSILDDFTRAWPNAQQDAMARPATENDAGA
jgi:hypothetical protein